MEAPGLIQEETKLATHGAGRVRAKIGAAAIYGLAALSIVFLWTIMARTEFRKPPFASVQAILTAEATKPFAYRRLLPETASAMTHLAPQRMWDRFSKFVDNNARLRQLVREHLGWKPEHDGLMVCATALITASALGFMLCFRSLIRHCYVAPPWLEHLLAAVFGFGLLGGRGPTLGWHMYPYDIPAAFLFLLTVLAIHRGRWSFVVPFALAAYNKETAVLLIPAFLLLWPGRRSGGRWAAAMLLATLYAGIQLWIRFRLQQSPTGVDWFMRMLASNLIGVFMGSWRLALWALLAVMIIKHWKQLPALPRKMMFVPIVLVSAAMMNGLAFEYRQYLEAYAFVGVVLVQIGFSEAGLQRYFRPRPGM